MRGYKNFEGTPHPGDLCHLVEIGYTENAINANGYPEPKDVVLCRVWASAVDAGNQHYRAADVMNTEQVINFTIRYRKDVKPGMWVRFQDDRPVGYRTYVYLNLWSDIDPTDMANRIRRAMYDADFWMLEESDKGYNQPAYDPATRTYTVQWTWVYWQEAPLGGNAHADGTAGL